MNILDYIKTNILYLDGGMGTLLQEKGLKPGELPERWNIQHPDIIKEIHKQYFDAGSNVVNTNTFGANLLKFTDCELEEIIKTALIIAKEAALESSGAQPKWVALDIGPSGKLLKPYGDLDFEDAVSLFGRIVKIGAKYGADLVFIETMNDSLETKAALLAAKENSSLPVFVSNAYGEDGKLMTGASPSAMVAMLEGMGADVIGVNCSLGPKALLPVVKEYAEYASVPLLVKPNAGMPKSIDGKTVYELTEEKFSMEVEELLKIGVCAAGGCCGTTPNYIKDLVSKTALIYHRKTTIKQRTIVSSYTHSVEFGNRPILIGERINPTGKKRFKEALKNEDFNYILNEGIKQEEHGAHILDVNVGLPEIDEPKMLKRAVLELQAVTSLPLQIDTSDPIAMEAALRVYNGKALINSVSGKQESMDTIFPLAKKYGGVIVALTLDENGIPNSAEERLKIAEKILLCAKSYGISKKDIIFDPLALTVSADNTAGVETIKAVKLITEKLGCYTSLGISNVSFGLPSRDLLNSAFFTLALNNGLSAAIMNPYSEAMLGAYYSFLAINGKDENFQNYIDFSNSICNVDKSLLLDNKENFSDVSSMLQDAIIKGLKGLAFEYTKQLISNTDPLSIINDIIVPTLDKVGIGFEEKRVFLPQLLMSAEAAKESFEVIKSSVKKGTVADKGCFILATVKGDIHDIGKNIVKLLLENYGYSVIDLGKDVPPETIVEAIIKHKASIAGLSALMTTTVPSMQQTIALIRNRTPWCKVIVGGAVLTQEYADSIGADKYAKDAMEAVRYAEFILGEK